MARGSFLPMTISSCLSTGFDQIQIDQIFVFKVEVLCLSLVECPPDAKEFNVMCPKDPKTSFVNVIASFQVYLFLAANKHDSVVKIAEKNKDSIKKTIMVLNTNI